MTFCLGMRIEDGLVGIADTRVTSGSEYITAKKANAYEVDDGTFFVMTSGLRSVRDKALTYFNNELKTLNEPIDRLFKVVNIFADQIRKVASEDREALVANGNKFSINVLIGGQCRDDEDHRLYQIYPEANWVEIGPGTPYHIIGATGYGKPVLDRALHFGDSMEYAMKVGCLAFDSTRISAANVGFPLDVMLYEKGSFRIVEHRYDEEDFKELSAFWQDRLRTAIDKMDPEWVGSIFNKLKETDSP